MVFFELKVGFYSNPKRFFFIIIVEWRLVPSKPNFYLYLGKTNGEVSVDLNVVYLCVTTSNWDVNVRS